MKNIQPNEINTDFRAATIAAEMIERGEINPDQIVILPAGPQQRAYAKEIASVSTYQSLYRNREIVRININREGLYDMLPEGLFHLPPSSSVMITEEAMIKDIRQRREEEKQARNFFAPIEAELYNIRTLIEGYESRLDKKSEYDDLINIFLKEWKEFKCFTKQQMIIMLQVLPVIHEHRNDLPFISSVFSLMFKTDIKLEYRLIDMDIPEEFLEKMDTKIGVGVLGVNFISGRVKEQVEGLHITIGPINAAEMIAFLPTTRSATALNVLLSYFIPLQTTVTTQFNIDASNQKLVLGDEHSNSCLGFTTYLGN